MALVPSEGTFLFVSDLVDYIMVDNDIEWEPNFRTYEDESQFTEDIALAVIKIGEKKYLDIVQQSEEMKRIPVETDQEFSQYITKIAGFIFQQDSSCVTFFTFCAYATLLTVFSERNGISGSADAAVYVIADVLEKQLSLYFRNRTIWEKLRTEAEKCIETETKFSFAVEFMSHVMHMEGVEWKTSLEACDPENEFKKVVRTMDKIRMKRYSEIIQEFNNIYGTTLKTKDQFTDYIKEIAQSYFNDNFDSLKFLNYCVHAGLLAVLSERNEIHGSADAAVFAIIEVLGMKELKSEEFWDTLHKAALNYVEAETYLSFAISVMSHVMKMKGVEWRTSFEVCDTESDFMNVIGMTVDKIGRKNRRKVSAEFDSINKTTVNTKDQFADYVKERANTYFERGYRPIQYLAYCVHVTNLAALAEMNEINGSADITVQIMADTSGKVIPEEIKGLTIWEELYDEAKDYIKFMGSREEETSQAKRKRTS